MDAQADGLDGKSAGAADQVADGGQDAGRSGGPGLVPTDAFRRQRRLRSVALAVVLAALVVLFYVVTIVKLGGNVMNRPL